MNNSKAAPKAHPLTYIAAFTVSLLLFLLLGWLVATMLFKSLGGFNLVKGLLM
jgi:hypothetical protein